MISADASLLGEAVVYSSKRSALTETARKITSAGYVGGRFTTFPGFHLFRDNGFSRLQLCPEAF